VNDSVYLVTELGETRLGTVEEIIGTNGDFYNEGGPGESLKSIFSDLVANLVSDNEDCEEIRLEIR